MVRLSNVSTMRKLRAPNGTNDYVPKCDHCGEEIEVFYTPGGLNRWRHIGSSKRWCDLPEVPGVAKKPATHKGSMVPFGRFHRLPIDPSQIPAEQDALEGDIQGLVDIIDELEDLRHRLRYDG